jgi:D-glycero-D-manno-heptose 1,7-bisphosphate phosphatase
MTGRVIILDRDGVINYDDDEYIKSVDEWIPIPGSLEAIGRLTRGGYRVFVATNQSGLGRGLYDRQTLNAMHDKMRRLAADHGGVIETVYYCPHTPEEDCRCRKPKPGLLQDIAAALGTDLHGVPAVGDSLRDIQAAAAVGARPILVRTGKGRETETRLGGMVVPVYDDLAGAAAHLLAS